MPVRQLAEHRDVLVVGTTGWNPASVPLDTGRVGQNGTYWYVPVRTAMIRSSSEVSLAFRSGMHRGYNLKQLVYRLCERRFVRTTSPKWAVHILHIGNNICIFCISCILFCIFCILLHTDLNCILCIFHILIVIFCILFHILFDIFCIYISMAYFAYYAYKCTYWVHIFLHIILHI
jgi:hypothetical protein